MKKIFKRFSKIILSLFMVSLFASCDLFQAPMKNFFEEYSTGVGILSVDYGLSLVTDADGVLCMPSGKNREITFSLRNPKNFELDLLYDALDPGLSIVPISCVQKEDRNIVSFTLPNSDLLLKEGGEDWHGVFRVKKKIIPYDESETFPVSFRINSVPLAPEGAVVLVTDQVVDQTYVVCFNLTDANMCKVVHKDLKKLIVSSSQGKEWVYDLSVDAAGKITAVPASGTPNNISDNDSTNRFKANQAQGSAGLGFTEGTNPVYIETGDALVDIQNDIKYTIRLVDEKGLSATTNTSVYTQKLEVPKAWSVPQLDSETSIEFVSGSTNTDLNQADDGATYVKIVQPVVTTGLQSVSGTRVEYEIFASTDAGVTYTESVGTGSVTGNTNIPVPPFACKVKLVSKKTNYVDSEPIEFMLKSKCNRVFVGGAGTADGWGTKERPLDKISTVLAKDRLTNKTDSQNTIFVLSDIQDDGLTIDNNLTLTLEGSGSKRKIKPVSGSTNSFASASGTYTQLNIKNIELTGYTAAANGGALKVNGARVVLQNSEINGNSSEMKGGAVYLENGASFVLEGSSSISGNTATGASSKGNGVYVSANTTFAITEDSYVNTDNDVYLETGAYIYADAACTYPVVAKITPQVYPADPVATEVKLAVAYDQANPLTTDFCNTKFRITANPAKPDIEYYVIYSVLKNYGVLAQGTVASVNSVVPTKVKFKQIYIKGVPVTFIAEDQDGNPITPDSTTISLKIRRDDISTPGTKQNGYAVATIPAALESTLQNGKLDGEEVMVEMSLTKRGITFFDRQALDPSMSINSTVMLNTAIELINSLSDTSHVNVKLDTDISVDDSTPLLGASDEKPFNGTFDGNGKTITFKRTKTNPEGWKTGLVGILGQTGVIKNIIVDGNYDNLYSYSTSVSLSGIAITNNGLIINCINKLDFSINSKSPSAGIVIYNHGKVVNCINYGNLTNRSNHFWSMESSHMGGIAAHNEGEIENCANFGTLSCLYDATVTVVPNGLPGAIVSHQGVYASGFEGVGRNCYWKENCISKNCGSEGAAYNSYAFRNSKYDFLYTYGKKNPNYSIDISNKYDPTHVYSCGTFADLDSSIVAGTTTNADTSAAQVLTYNGNLLTVMNNYVTANAAAMPDLVSWKRVGDELTLDN